MSGTGPVRAVLAAIESGAGSVQDLVRRTGLDRELVILALDRLIALGRLRGAELPAGCAAGGCGSCTEAVAIADGTGCAAVRRARGPVLLTLTSNETATADRRSGRP